MIDRRLTLLLVSVQLFVLVSNAERARNDNLQNEENSVAENEQENDEGKKNILESCIPLNRNPTLPFRCSPSFQTFSNEEEGDNTEAQFRHCCSSGHNHSSKSTDYNVHVICLRWPVRKEIQQYVEIRW
jgi:ABC-type nickel/cobalt efflux system permease component RcnA